MLKFAIIEPNILACLGLKDLLLRLMPTVEIDLFTDAREFVLPDMLSGSRENKDLRGSCKREQSSLLELPSVAESRQRQSARPSEYLHYFVASRIFFEQAAFFRSHNRRVIVLVAGDMQIAGCWTLNVCQSEHALIKSILSLMHDGHQHAAQEAQEAARASRTPLPADRALTPRETEVAVLLTKGLINKEVAHRLNISLTTVISHRRSIMEKLRARSLADITIYCVLNGLVDVSEI